MLDRERKPNTFVSDDRKLWALAELENGRSVRDVASELGVTTPALYNWRRYFKEYGKFYPSQSEQRARAAARRAEMEARVQPKNEPQMYTREDRVRIVTAYEDGDLTAREIAERYGVPHPTLLSWRDLVTEGEPDPRQVSMWEPATASAPPAPSEPSEPSAPSAPLEPHPAIAEAAELREECARLRTQLLGAAKTHGERMVAVEARVTYAEGRAEKMTREFARACAATDAANRAREEADARVAAKEAERAQAVEMVKSQAERVRELEAQRVDLVAELHAARAKLAEAPAPSADEGAMKALREENEKLRKRVQVLAGMLSES